MSRGRAAVASPHHAASRAGADVLRAGGTAIDAVVATNAMLGVVYPHMCGVGGDLFLLHHEARTGEATCLNASGPAPALATRAAFAARGLDAVPARGPLPVTVPGCVAGWDAALARFGSRPLGELLAPAIAAAEDGVEPTERLAGWIAGARELLAAAPLLRERFLAPAGRRLRQPELGRTLRAVATGGAEGFYRGAVADGIDAAMRAADGLLRREDLAAYAPEWVDPVRARHRELEVVVTPPNSQGVTALMMLNALELLGAERLAPGTAAHVEALAAAARAAYAERDAYVADPRFVRVPVERLVDPGAMRRALAAPAAVPARATLDGDTVYLCAVDADGNACSAIQSLFQGFGSGFVAGDTGVLLHNRGHAFTLTEGAPNALEPGKRPLHTLMATLAYEDGRLRYVLGSMGGDAQPQIVVQLLDRMLRGESPQAAVDAPRTVHGRILGEGGGELVWAEEDVGPALAELEERGVRVEVVPARDERMGHAHAIALGPGGAVGAGADPRSDGAALLV